MEKSIQSLFNLANMSEIFETENEINLPLNYILENIKKHLDAAFKVNLSKMQAQCQG